MTEYGEYDARGQIVRDTQVCAVTGRAIRPGDVIVNVPGTRYFYRVTATAFNQLTPQKRAALARAIPADTPTGAVSAQKSASADFVRADSADTDNQRTDDADKAEGE